MLAQLYWDATRNGSALIAEFLAAFYSPSAAPLIQEHMDAFTEEVEATSPHFTSH